MFAKVIKTSEASEKAWESRARAVDVSTGEPDHQKVVTHLTKSFDGKPWQSVAPKFAKSMKRLSSIGYKMDGKASNSTKAVYRSKSGRGVEARVTLSKDGSHYLSIKPL